MQEFARREKFNHKQDFFFQVCGASVAVGVIQRAFVDDSANTGAELFWCGLFWGVSSQHVAKNTAKGVEICAVCGIFIIQRFRCSIIDRALCDSDFMVLIFLFSGNVKIDDLHGDRVMNARDFGIGAVCQRESVREHDILRREITVYDVKPAQRFESFT